MTVEDYNSHKGEDDENFEVYSPPTIISSGSDDDNDFKGNLILVTFCTILIMLRRKFQTSRNSYNQSALTTALIAAGAATKTTN